MSIDDTRIVALIAGWKQSLMVANQSDDWSAHQVEYCSNLSDTLALLGELQRWRSGCTGRHGSQMPCVEQMSHEPFMDIIQAQRVQIDSLKRQLRIPKFAVGETVRYLEATTQIADIDIRYILSGGTVASVHMLSKIDWCQCSRPKLSRESTVCENCAKPIKGSAL